MDGIEYDERDVVMVEIARGVVPDLMAALNHHRPNADGMILDFEIVGLDRGRAMIRNTIWTEASWLVRDQG